MGPFSTSCFFPNPLSPLNDPVPLPSAFHLSILIAYVYIVHSEKTGISHLYVVLKPFTLYFIEAALEALILCMYD